MSTRIFERGRSAPHSSAPAAAARFNRDGESIGYLYWNDLCRDRAYRTVASDIVTIDGTRLVVSTYWTGVSQKQDEAAGIFATKLVAPQPMNDDHDKWIRRYDSIYEASANHVEIVDGLRCGRWPS